MASRSVKVSIERRRAGGDMNDNNPSVLPGHELAGLDGLPSPPAAEAVVHYSRFAQIGSFPAHPSEPVADASGPPSMDLSAERPDRVLALGKRTVTFACVGSFLFHAAIVAALLVTMVATPEDAVEEAGDTVSVIMLGSSDMDQMSAGEESKDPQPEEITADAVQPETVQPADVTPAETEAVQPMPQTMEAAQPSQQVSPETVVSPEPEVLATQAPAETTVVQPMTASVQPTDAESTEVRPAEPVEVQPTETAQAAIPPTEVVTPVEKPAQQAKPVEKPKDVVKKPVPKAVKKAGSGGESEQDSKKGSAEGTETAQSNTNSLTDGQRSGSGSAAVANYPGKVQSRIRRAVRLSSKYEKGITVRVRLTIGSGGELSSLSVARSSGIPELDEAVTDGVRRAAPFPPLPPEWGKPSWSFTQEVQVTGR
ncbi:MULTISPECIES: TonB family protein [unclassified Rhizobium]|uniref:energy transducer TonB family protein n=1 Tax=unclassified Rhizobium TaxID=2613769 RepID=UPI000CDF52D2|nr:MULTISPECIES: TonB family protein [Rhizobium]AVA22556.1 TonB family transporter protein [Rhizobium sp. NXC24]MDK4738432.1 TonB family protein [Rhizobium sp. CNPSo 3464]UWU19944.1 TonB family protein [Rhizobium tropici]